MLIVGHRGAAGHEPENTIRSLECAIAMGADAVEIDVRLSVDGELIIMHDARLERTTNGIGFVARKTLEQLRTLDAGAGEKIPTLREVFDTVDRRAVINIELKYEGTSALVVELISEYVDRGWSPDDFIVSSFLRGEMAAIADPRVRKGVLFTRPGPWWPLVARRLKPWSVHPAARYTTQKFVHAAHRSGWKVIPYTVNALEEISRLRALGVDGIFTDFPDRAREIVTSTVVPHSTAEIG